MKVCTKCQRTHHVTAFNVCNRNKDGLQSHCKACRAVWYVACRNAKRARARGGAADTDDDATADAGGGQAEAEAEAEPAHDDASAAPDDHVVPRAAFEFVEPVLAAWQRQHDDIASLKGQLQAKIEELAAVDAEVSELRQRLQAKEVAFDALQAEHAQAAAERHKEHAGGGGGAQTIAVMQVCIDDLRRDKTQLLQELERQRGDLDRLRRVMDRMHEEAQPNALFMQLPESLRDWARDAPDSGLALPGLPRFHAVADSV